MENTRKASRRDSPAELTGLLAVLVSALLASCYNPSIESEGSGGKRIVGTAGGGGNRGAGGASVVVIDLTPPDAAEDTRPRGPYCGDGQLSGGEQCDDGNTTSGDGCNRACQMEANYECPTPGEACINQAVCGNHKLTSNEHCDDGNTKSGDGCSSTCRYEAFCGDGKVDPGEQCDPKDPESPPCTDNCTKIIL
jgi:cysteine-rich repeat protein